MKEKGREFLKIILVQIFVFLIYQMTRFLFCQIGKLSEIFQISEYMNTSAADCVEY